MSTKQETVQAQWQRYQWVRDHGHIEYVKKADKCERFFRGEQWSKEDLARLRKQRRPALTINKILSTVSAILGEQIHNRTEISFQPRSGAPEQMTDVLTKVFRQISDTNQLDWKRADMFADGIITSRGYLDVRLDFTDSMMGEVRVTNLNPKNVVVDCDADEYDPDTWNDVFITKWLTTMDIELLFGKKHADALRGRDTSALQYGYDSIDAQRDRFGDNFLAQSYTSGSNQSAARNIRVLERQHRVVAMQEHFVDPSTGDMRPIPEDWDDERKQQYMMQYPVSIIKRPVKRIRWTVTADDVVLHDEWSPYGHFTVVPYFPFFRRGQTIGLVENLIDPQEALNKVSSQELHVINTTANSGWKVKTGALANMTIEELEMRGAETGLVVELNDMDGLDKILPNQYPSGLDRASMKAEEHIKTISGVSDSMQGFDREDVAAKAIQAKQQRGSANFAKPMDNLIRSDWLLARVILDLVQGYYTEPRILNIVGDRMTNATEKVEVNTPQPDGTILNDLTLGEFDIIVSATPARETLEDSQFEQALQLKQLGVPIPDSVLIENSRLQRRGEIIKQMEAASQSPEAQQQMQLQQQMAEAELAKTQAEAAKQQADTTLKQAKAQQTTATIDQKSIDIAHRIQTDEATPTGTSEVEQHKMQLEQLKVQHQIDMDTQKLEIEKQKAAHEMQMKETQMKEAKEAEGMRKRVEAAKGRKSKSTPKQPTLTDNDGDET